MTYSTQARNLFTKDYFTCPTVIYNYCVSEEAKMTDRRKPSVKKLEKQPMNVKTPLSKQQKEVLDWMRVNIPTKKTKFLHSHKVDYFIGSKAIDLLVHFFILIFHFMYPMNEITHPLIFS